MEIADTRSAAAFLDRDGTVVQEAHYLADPDRVELIPGAPAAIRALRGAGLKIVVVTNQSGIARGLYSQADYHAVAARLDEMLTAEGALPDATLFCPHHPDVGGPCRCRKPGLGMYEEAATTLGVDLGSSFYVGDKLSDVLPGLEVGGTGILVRTGYGSDTELMSPAGIGVADDLPAAAKMILRDVRVRG